MGCTIEQVVEHVADHPLAIHHVGDAPRQQAQHAGYTKSPAQGIVPVHQQRVGKIVALGETQVAGGVVAADSPYFGAQSLKIGVAVAEGTGLGGAARGVVLRVEEKNQRFAPEGVAATLDTTPVRQGDQGCAIAGKQGCRHGGKAYIEQTLDTSWLPGGSVLVRETARLAGGLALLATMESYKDRDLRTMQEQTNLWDQPELLGSVMPLPAPASAHRPALSAPQAVPAPVAVTLPSLSAMAARGLPSAPERLLILDTETTALSPADGHCIEVGAVLFHVPSRSVLCQISFLLPAASNDAEAVNGIDAAVTRLSQPWQASLACFEAMVGSADALLAHNAAFDRQWFGQGPLPFLNKPWICSMDDIRWPAERRLRATPSVTDLALAYGVPVWAAHRALTDCTYLVQVLERCSDLEALLQAALEPKRLYRACLSYAERHRAKEAGFRWNQPVSNAWSRRLSEREAEALPFRVQPVEPDDRNAADSRRQEGQLAPLPRTA